MGKLLSSILMLTLAGNVWADSPEEKRTKIQKMRADVLERLYKEAPNTREEISGSKGYAVMSNIGVNIIFFSAAGGSGVVFHNGTGKNTYMKMASAGIGIGLGIKDFRGVFIFHTQNAIESFISSGWDFSGQADATAKSGDKGGEASGAATIVKGTTIYQLTETGLALQATLQGTKYWPNDSLN